MNRVIKFRGLSISEPGWVYGLPRFYKSGRVEIFDGDCAYYVKPETVSEFIGLQDKNGSDIYEGHICSVSAEEPLMTDQFSTDENWEIKMKVVFDKDYCGFVFKDSACCTLPELDSCEAVIEVIGNIYQNPELI